MGVALVLGSAGSALPSTPSVATTSTPTKLVAFSSCDTAVEGFRRAATPYVTAYGFRSGPPRGPWRALENITEQATQPQEAAGAAGPDHSTTNVHEAGVDEPDLVKTDGRRIVSVADGKLRVLDVAARGLAGTLDLPAGPTAELLVHGDRALVVHGSPGIPADIGWTGGNTQLLLVDLSGEPRKIGTLKLEGSYVDSRSIDAVARVVIRSAPQLPFVTPEPKRSIDQAWHHNRDIVARSSIDDWLPRYELDQGGERRSGLLVDCEHVSHPTTYSGTSMLTVLTFDLERELGTGDPVSIVADGDTVYGNHSHLYVADDHLPWMMPRRAVSMRQREMATDIHQFDISQPGPPRHLASGTVRGRLLNQYSLSEHDGHLRVATTLSAPDEPATGSSNSVTVLAGQEGKLVEVGRLDGLGIGERIHAVRFLGPTGYVVTFRQVDPLYTLDLSDPRRPRAVGELKITGYSAYLHPVGEGRVLGVGQEATLQGRALGTQISLFDTSDPARPTRIATHQVPSTRSEVEDDPHAFLYWPATGHIVVSVYGRPRGVSQGMVATGALVLRLEDNALTEIGFLHHPGERYGGPRRALMIGNTLWTVANSGALASDPDTLEQRAWIHFG
ncbi:hypothetical protein GCM10012275_46000 [Longimycelium tulufanense]|uniref:Uncharacterized protein n=1 Tax=Longimycelium tulufanense TaxID=907463 RepID=A0A8J3CI03_9PSEU|nr:hypothetical protein GCM10012275_46000 [Longimycelium tulufanense]